MIPVLETLSRMKARDQMGSTVLMHCCSAQMSEEIQEVLVRKVLATVTKAELNATDHCEKSAVDYAVESGCFQASKLLQDAKAVDMNGHTSFQRDVLQDSAPLVQFLLTALPKGRRRETLQEAATRNS